MLVIGIDTKTPLPKWQEMIRYDVVIITKPRFEAEYRDNDLHTGKRGRGEERFQSSLTDIRWLRVICDEGHGFAGSASRTNAMAMLDKLYVERRWVVSGTPANTMLGVEVGLAANETNENTDVDMQETLQSRKKSDTLDQESKDIERFTTHRHQLLESAALGKQRCGYRELASLSCTARSKWSAAKSCVPPSAIA